MHIIQNRTFTRLLSVSLLWLGACATAGELDDGVPLPDPRVGDLLGVPATGAYCFTMANNYNGNRRIPVVFAGNGDARLVVRRETWEDLLARDVDGERGETK